MENKSWTVTYRNRDNGQRITAAVFAEDQQQAREKAQADGQIGSHDVWEVEAIEPHEETLARILIAKFAKKQQGGHFACPRCGKMTMDAESVTRNALSRRVDCYICDTCGTVEALEDFTHKQDPLSSWAITREPERWHMLSWISDNIEIAGHEGRWYIIDEGDFQITPDVNGKPETLTAHLFLLESRKFGDAAACLIVDKKKQIVMEDVWNGFDDLEDAGWEKVQKIECPVCKGEFLREDMTFTRDCHGITYRLVCFDCYEKVMAKGYDGAYYTEADECMEEDY